VADERSILGRRVYHARRRIDTYTDATAGNTDSDAAAGNTDTDATAGNADADTDTSSGMCGTDVPGERAADRDT